MPYINIIENWSISLFFAITEIWGIIVYTILFWQLTNWIYSKQKACKFYPQIGIYNNMGAFFAGLLIYLTHNTYWLGFFSSSSEKLSFLLMIVILMHLLIFFIFQCISWNNKLSINAHIIPSEQQTITIDIIKSKNNKILIYLSFLVFSYGLTLNHIDLLYKHVIKKMTIDISELSLLLGFVTIGMSLVSILICSIAKKMLSTLKWYQAALVSPIILAAIAVIFFILFIQSQYFGFQVDFLIVIVGSIYLSFNKALKDAFYEPSKEIVYIPLDVKSKQEGKAVLSLVGNKISKATNSIFQQLFILLNGSIANSVLSIASLMMFSFCLWAFSVYRLSLILENDYFK